MTSQALRLLALLPAAALVLAGCSNSDSSDGTKTSDTTTSVSIVASTNVYGDIAESIAGDHADVTSLITSSSQDPHEYEASAQDKLALDDADIVVKNGGGYDPFIDTLMDSSSTNAAVLDAVEISGFKADPGEELNEHVWYSFPTVAKVAETLSQELATVDPDNAGTYQANYEAFAKQIDGLETSAKTLKATVGGRGAAITEPVPLYLLEAVGLVNKTPSEFSEAVEEGDDVPPRVLQQTLDLFKEDSVAVLAYNSQTADDTTEQVSAAAKAAGIPVVDFTETLPAGQSYIQWMQSNIDNLADALT
ncbi:MAG: zinc ABC transporter substrate-binding protein [Nocardioidaceae bacterium]